MKPRRHAESWLIRRDFRIAWRTTRHVGAPNAFAAAEAVGWPRVRQADLRTSSPEEYRLALARRLAHESRVDPSKRAGALALFREEAERRATKKARMQLGILASVGGALGIPGAGSVGMALLFESAHDLVQRQLSRRLP